MLLRSFDAHEEPISESIAAPAPEPESVFRGASNEQLMVSVVEHHAPLSIWNAGSIGRFFGSAPVSAS